MDPTVGRVAGIANIIAAVFAVLVIVLDLDHFGLIVALGLVILAALTLAVIILGRTPGWPIWIARIFVVLLVLTSAVYGVLLQAYAAKEEDEPLAHVEIDTPSNGQTVRHCETVEGDSDLGREQEIWLAVVPDESSNDYYIQNGPVTRLEGGEWSSAACFGSEGLFHVVAVVAGPNTRSVFVAVRDSCTATGHCPPIGKFWDNRAVADRISVNAQAPTPPTPTASPSPVSGPVTQTPTPTTTTACPPPPPPPTTPPPSITLSTDRGVSGDEIAVVGAHFSACSTVTIRLKDETTGTNYTLGNPTADGNGAFSLVVSIPYGGDGDRNTVPIDRGHVYRITVTGMPGFREFDVA